MKCKECGHFKRIANTDETGQGICGFPMSYFPTQLDSECFCTPKPYTCGDCSHFREGDTACFTCREDDSAYQDYGLCGGFIDYQEDVVYKALIEWKLRGLDVQDKLNSVLEEVNEFKAPWEINPEKDEGDEC